MKYVHPEIGKVFDTEVNSVNTIVIENQRLFYVLCNDIFIQTQGMDGKSVFSIGDKPVDAAKNVEFLNQFVPFEINRKNLLTKLVAVSEKISVSEDYYEETMSLLANIENYVIKIEEALTGDITCSKLSIGSILKALGMEFNNDYESLGEKVIDYMQLVRAYDREKLFILVNFRDYLDDGEMENFIETVFRHEFHVIMIESKEHRLLEKEHRYLIDQDLCEIS